MIKLDILSDPICPWCFIGKANLDRALEARPSHPFVVEWHPFQLNPEMPRAGMDRRAYLEAKFGGREKAVAAYAPIEAAAEGFMRSALHSSTHAVFVGLLVAGVAVLLSLALVPRRFPSLDPRGG